MSMIAFFTLPVNLIGLESLSDNLIGLESLSEGDRAGPGADEQAH